MMMFMAMKRRIIPSNLLLFKEKMLISVLPIIDPIKGIRKCMIPTMILSFRHIFLGIDVALPIPSDNEKVSMLKAMAINRQEMISFIIYSNKYYDDRKFFMSDI